MAKHPVLDPTEHPRPHIDVPYSIVGKYPFTGHRMHELLGLFVHWWCHAVWKKDPTFIGGYKLDDDDIRAFTGAGFLVKRRGVLYLTGPNKDKHWLVGLPKKFSTYAIEAVGRDIVKIGKTLDVERRLEELQIAAGHELALLGFVRNDIEGEVHRQLRAMRAHVRGEWFRLDEATREVLRARGLLVVR